MPFQKIEYAGGAVSVWGAFWSAVLGAMGWITANATLCGLVIAAVGLLIQAVTAAHNSDIRNAENARRAEEHELRMALLRARIDEQIGECDDAVI